MPAWVTGHCPRRRGRRGCSVLKALLFDLDGTLADTDPLHFQAFRRALGERGREMARDEYDRHLSGRANEESMEHLFPGAPPAEQRAFAERKEQLFRQSLKRLTPTPGAAKLLAWADQASLATALVTNAPAENVDMELVRLGMEGRFGVVIVGGDLERMKPDPLPYRTALKRLGVEAAAGIAFEDSTSGVRSAKGAGLETIALTVTQHEATLRDAGADLAVADFRDRRLWSLLESRLSGPALR